MNRHCGVWALGFLVVAEVLDGLLAGGNLDRALVAMPAWQQVGLVEWAHFSLYADLGHGLLLYPAMAIGATVAIAGAAALCMGSDTDLSRVRLPVCVAAGLMIAALPFSFKAAPFMLSLRRIDSGDANALAHAFSGFEFWGRLQGAFHIASFFAMVWAIIALMSTRSAGQKEAER